MKEQTIIQMTFADLRKFASEVATQTAMQIQRRPEMYTFDEVKDTFKVSMRTVQNWEKEGVFTAKRIGGKPYVSAEEVERMMMS